MIFVNIVQQYTTKNKSYSSPTKITPKGIMLHSIGVPQPKASVLRNNYNVESSSVSVHGFIDANNGDFYQCLPFNYKANHCGYGSKGKSATANLTHIAIEMCEPSNIKYTSGASFTCSDKAKARVFVDTAYKSAVELFAKICKDYGFDPLKDGVIISHKEGSDRGVASAHGDPEHLWKGLGCSYTMDGFRKDVKAAMGGTVEAPKTETVKKITYRVRKSWTDSKSQLGAYTVLDNAKKTADANPGFYVFDEDGKVVYPEEKPAQPTQTVPFAGQVKIDNLLIRKGPGTNYGYNTGNYTGKGVFTIVEIQNGTGSSKGWGLLKSYQSARNGWISLDYVTKL